MLKLYSAFHRYGGFRLDGLWSTEAFMGEEVAPRLDLSIEPPDLPEGVDPAVRVLAVRYAQK